MRVVLLAVLFVLRGEADVDRREQAEDEHLDDAHERSEDHDRDRNEQRDHAEHDRAEVC